MSRQLIGKDATYSEIKDCARKNGMLTLFESGIRLVEQGLTSFEEVCRVTADD
jgi:protein transport protein HofB